MTPSTDHAQQILEKTISAVTLLQGRNWPDLATRLEEDQEVTLSYKVTITLRDGESGTQADKDHRVKTTISFSKRFTDTTESSLEDPAQPGLPGLDDDQSPEARKRYSIAEEVEGAIRDYPDKDKIRLRFERVREFDPVTYATDDSFDGFYEGIAELIASRSAREGGDVEAGQGNTPFGGLLDEATLRSTAPKLDLKLPELPLTGSFPFQRKFRAAAKKTTPPWTEVQINFMISLLDACETPTAQWDTLRPHCIASNTPAPDPSAPLTCIVGGKELPLVPVKLEPGFAADRTMMVFEVAAKEAGWPEDSLSIVRDHITTIKTEAGDFAQQANEATHAYLSEFCREPAE